jgi:quercetin dioxygenase-like cupin family protein
VFGTTGTLPTVEPAGMPATTVDDEREYSEAKFTAREVFRSDHSKVVCGYFEPGQFIPVHAPDSDVTVVVQSGRGIVRDGEQTHQIAPGSVVTVPAGQNRGVRAEAERLEAVLVTAPPPSDADHELVRQGIKRDEFEPRPSAE